jgi:putative colanic acid biosynthesis glycosyltransferase WcaI
VRILFLNRSFWPDPEATGQFLTELCDDLSQEHEITVVAGRTLHAPNRMHGLVSREQRGRITIVRAWGTTLPKTRIAARLANLATYYVVGAGAALGADRPDVIVAATDPPLLGALGALLKRRFRCRLVYNVRDLYPDIAIANRGLKSRTLLALLDLGGRIAYDHAELVVTLGHDMAERIVAKGVPAAKVSVIPDWVDCAQIRPLPSNPFRAQFGDRFIVMYSGNLGLSQKLEVALDAAVRLRGDRRILFVFIGAGARKDVLVAHARERGLDNVTFLPYRDKGQLPESLGAADLHLVPLAPGAAGCLVPSKIYGILAAGRPFVAVMDAHGEAARIAREHSVGFVVPPGDSGALARVIEDAAANPGALRMMGVRARRVAELEYDRPIVVRRFNSMLASVANRA